MLHPLLGLCSWVLREYFGRINFMKTFQELKNLNKTRFAPLSVLPIFKANCSQIWCRMGRGKVIERFLSDRWGCLVRKMGEFHRNSWNTAGGSRVTVDPTPLAPLLPPPFFAFWLGYIFSLFFQLATSSLLISPFFSIRTIHQFSLSNLGHTHGTPNFWNFPNNFRKYQLCPQLQILITSSL